MNWLIISLGIAAACCGIVWVNTHRLSSEFERGRNLRQLRLWFIKGLCLPFALWMVMNLGVSLELQPFMPQIQAAQNRGTGWIPVFLRVTAAGLFAISSYWAAVSSCWMLYRTSTGLEGEARSDFRALCLTSLFGMMIPAIIIVWAGGLGLGVAVLAVCLPIAGYAPALLRRVKFPPMYARAIAKLKMGKYSDAEWEILRQLENAESDFNGWLMLAELYASQFKDLSEAEQIVLEICDQPAVTPSQISVALHKLADWQLNIADDPKAARRALQVISFRLPRTHLAHMAQARSDHLPGTAEELREQRVAQTVPLPALGDRLDDNAGDIESAADPSQAATLANKLSERLTRDPGDASTRERFARVLAEQLGKANLAIEQIELLLESADPAEGKRADWLGLLAAWQMKYQDDLVAARKSLERLLHEFPDSPQAFAAKRRLHILKSDSLPEPPREPRPKIRITLDGT